MGYGALLPPDPRRDPLADEILELQRQQGRPVPKATQANGRFLAPGQLSKKAQRARSSLVTAPTPPPADMPRPSLDQAIEAEMLDAELPPPPPPTESLDPVEEQRARHREEWRARKQTQPVVHLAPSVEPTPLDQLPPPTTPLSGACDAPVFLRLNSRRILLECTLQGPHPNQPHMHQLPPVEDGDTVFVGWWHSGE